MVVMITTLGLQLTVSDAVEGIEDHSGITICGPSKLQSFIDTTKYFMKVPIHMIRFNNSFHCNDIQINSISLIIAMITITIIIHLIMIVITAIMMKIIIIINNKYIINLFMNISVILVEHHHYKVNLI